MSKEEKIRGIANLIYSYLEGPVANQDFGRQMKLHDKCMIIANAIFTYLEREDA